MALHLRARSVAASALLVAACALAWPSSHTAAQQPERPSDGGISDRARAIHEEALVWDGHNDLPWRIRRETELAIDPMELERRLDEGHTDLVRLGESGIDAQFWSVYVPAGEPYPTATILEQIDLVKRLADRYPDHLEMAYTADDVVRIAASGRTASLLGAEGGHAIGNSLPVLRELYRAGVRYMTLTHSGTLAWADAAGDRAVHGGLTPFGEAVVREMNRLGMLVDLSHVTGEVMHDALDVARAPVIFSHSSVRALADHPRNVPDDVLRRLPENGGLVMITFVSHYLTPEAARLDLEADALEDSLRAAGLPADSVRSRMRAWDEAHPIPPGDVGTVADHVDHVVEVAGVEHVGVGSDWDGTSVLPAGLEDVSGLPKLTAELLRRGYSETELEMILGGSALRVLREAEGVAARLRGEPPGVERLQRRGAGDGGRR